MAFQFLHSPIRFTDRILDRPVDLRWPAAIFFGFIASRTFGNYLFFSRMVGQLPSHLSEGIDLMSLGVVFTLDILDAEKLLRPNVIITGGKIEKKISSI